MKKLLNKLLGDWLLSLKIQHVMFTALFACLAVVLVAQIGLRSAVTRTFFTNIESYEGVAMADAGNAVELGSITVTLLEGEPGDSVELLVNGTTAAVLDTVQKTLEIPSNCVVEVRAKERVRVKLDAVSDNLQLVTPLSEVAVEGGCRPLCRVHFK